MIQDKLNMIVAMTENRGIGVYNNLPWPTIREDMKKFHDLTQNSAVIMGYNTFSCINTALPTRLNIVLTKDIKKTNCPLSRNLTFTDSLNNALALAKTNQVIYGNDSWVIGGESIYKEFLPYVSKLYITLVKQNFYCDRFFPEIDKSIWQLESSEEGKTQEIPIEFQIWSRHCKEVSLDFVPGNRFAGFENKTVLEQKENKENGN